MLTYGLLFITIVVLMIICITEKDENIKLKKYIRESFQSMKQDKPDDLHFGK